MKKRLLIVGTTFAFMVIGAHVVARLIGCDPAIVLAGAALWCALVGHYDRQNS